MKHGNVSCARDLRISASVACQRGQWILIFVLDPRPDAALWNARTCIAFGPRIWPTKLVYESGPRIWSTNLVYESGPRIWFTILVYDSSLRTWFTNLSFRTSHTQHSDKCTIRRKILESDDTSNRFDSPTTTNAWKFVRKFSYVEQRWFLLGLLTL